MTSDQRHRPHRARETAENRLGEGSPSLADDGSAPLDAARERGNDLLRAAERALSSDSRRFLQASRQQGGQ